MKHLLRLTVLILLSGLFVACGGGDSGSTAGNNAGGGTGGGTGGGNPPQSFNSFVLSEVTSSTETTDPKDTNSIIFTFDNTDETAFDSVL